MNLSRKYSEDLPTTMSYDNKIAENSNDIVDLFRQFFQSIYSESSEENVDNFVKYYEDNDHMSKLLNVCQNIPTITFNEEDIIQSINDLPENMVMGPDNVPNCFIKKCVTSIARPIFHMLQASFAHKIMEKIVHPPDT